MELGWPLLVWQWVVVSGETQVLNSNSKTGVQDPPPWRVDTPTLGEILDPPLIGCSFWEKLC